MELVDLNSPMVTGETRHIAPGKISILVGVPLVVPVTDAPDIALAMHDHDKRPVPFGSLVSASKPETCNHAIRFMHDLTSNGMWQACYFEVSMYLMAPEVSVISIIADGLDKVDSPLVLSVNDGHSKIFTYEMPLGDNVESGLVATVYKHGNGWKLRTNGQCFAFDRHQLVQQLGLDVDWKRAWRERPKPPVPSPLSPKRRVSSVPSVPAPNSVSPAPSSRPSTSRGMPPIDMDKLNALEDETKSISSLLSDIFSDVKDVPAASSAGTVRTPAHQASSISGLDAGHANLLKEFVNRGEIPAADMESLCRVLSLMPAGAVDTINEWAFDKFSEAVIEDTGASYRVLPEFSKQIADLTV